MEKLISVELFQGSLRNTEVTDLALPFVVAYQKGLWMWCDYQDNRQRNILEKQRQWWNMDHPVPNHCLVIHILWQQLKSLFYFCLPRGVSPSTNPSLLPAGTWWATEIFTWPCVDLQGWNNLVPITVQLSKHLK